MVTPCCDHDIHKSLYWGTVAHIPEDDPELKVPYNAVRGLRSRYDMLVDHIPDLIECIEWDGTPYDSDHVYTFFLALGVPVEAARLLVKCHLRYMDGELVCHRSFRREREITSRRFGTCS